MEHVFIGISGLIGAGKVCGIARCAGVLLCFGFIEINWRVLFLALGDCLSMPPADLG
jgi:hypothetical protein